MRNDWIECRLGDVVTLKRGYDLPARDRVAGSVPIVSSSGITGFHCNAKVKGPGVITGRYGTLGDIFYIEKDFWPLNTTLYVQSFQGNDPRFVSYFLRTLNFEAQNAAGAVPGLNRNALHMLHVRCPSVTVQRRIADILSAYDDLIENNTRRIAILEEMAQSVYREWFVNFRFPGHEQVEMVESEVGPVPAGWEVRSFSAIAKFVNGFAFKPSHFQRAGRPIVKIAELKNGVSAKTPFNSGDGVPARYRVANGDVLFSWSADLDAYIWSHGDALLNQHLFNVLPTEGFTKLFLFYSLQDRMNEFRIRSQGTTMRHIKRSALNEVKVVVPPEALRRILDQQVQSISSMVINLTSRNHVLKCTRDLLLPRLVSGEIEVAAAEDALAGAV